MSGNTCAGIPLREPQEICLRAFARRECEKKYPDTSSKEYKTCVLYTKLTASGAERDDESRMSMLWKIVLFILVVVVVLYCLML